MFKDDIGLSAWVTRNVLGHVQGEKTKEEEHVGKVMEQDGVSRGHNDLR